MGDPLDPDLLVGYVRRDDVAGDAARLLCRIVQVECRTFDLAARLVDRLSLLGDDYASETFAVFQNQDGQGLSAADPVLPVA